MTDCDGAAADARRDRSIDRIATPARIVHGQNPA